MVGTRVFIGNLPYAVTEEQLRELLSTVADVTAVSLPADQLTGRRHGFALIDVASEPDAREIVREFNGYTLDARRLRVEQATDQVEREYLPKYASPPSVKRGKVQRRRTERG